MLILKVVLVVFAPFWLNIIFPKKRRWPRRRAAAFWAAEWARLAQNHTK